MLVWLLITQCSDIWVVGVGAVVDDLLGRVCPAERSSASFPVSKAVGRVSSLEAEDARLVQEQNSFFALASAVATAACAGRAAIGEFPWPYYFIGTRDCFTYNLVAKSEARVLHLSVCCQHALPKLLPHVFTHVLLFVCFI